MHRLLEAIDGIFKDHHGHTAQLWQWARKHHPTRRFHALVRWAGMHKHWNRAHRRVKRARWFAVKETIYRRKLKRLRKHHQQHGGQPTFQTWMANGCPLAGVHQSVKDYIARQVVNFGSACTATTNGVHASGSYHYSGEAGDTAGPNMSAGQQSEFTDHRTSTLELFGPINSSCLKNGTPITLGEGTSLETMHDNHVHRASA